MCLSNLFGDDPGDAQIKAAKISAETQWKMFEETKKLLAPYVNFGTEGMAAFKQQMPYLTSQFKPTMEQLEKTPGYQFALNQGLNATQNSMAARGLGSSGPAMQAAAGFAKDLASTTYQQQFQNDLAQKGQIYNMLQGPIQIGANAAAGQAGMGSQVATNVSNLQMQAGDAAAANIQRSNSGMDQMGGFLLRFLGL